MLTDLLTDLLAYLELALEEADEAVALLLQLEDHDGMAGGGLRLAVQFGELLLLLVDLVVDLILTLRAPLLEEAHPGALAGRGGGGGEGVGVVEGAPG